MRVPLGVLFGCSLLFGCTSERRIVPHPSDGNTGDDDDTTTTWTHTGLHTGDTGGPVGPASIVVDEIMPGNASTVNGSDGVSFPDWVEVVNTGDEPFALSRLQLRNGDGDIWFGNADDGSIDPGEYRLLWLADRPDGTEVGNWTGFKVDKDGDDLVVIVDDHLQETISWDELPEDVSWARTPDLTGDFAATAWATPGKVNRDTPSPTLNVADERWFVKDYVHQILFTMSAAGFSTVGQYDRPEIHVMMDVDGVHFQNIGLKEKGSASYDPMTGKPEFIVDVNQWDPGTVLDGLKAFKLHNGKVQDPTRVHEDLTYGLARAAGLMAPRVGWAELWITHGSRTEYYGLYGITEKHDDQFVKYFHPDEELTGVVLEPNETEGGGWGGDFGSGGVQNWNREEGPNPPDPDSAHSLVMVDTLAAQTASDANVAEMWNYLDKEKFLTYMAWEVLVNNTDGYKAPNNWRVFVDGDTHLVSLMPSGSEWTWDGAANTWYSNGSLSRWCMRNEGCKHEFAEHVLTMADLVESLDLDDEFARQSAFLDPLIQKDHRYDGWQTVEQGRHNTWQYLHENPNDARHQVYQTYPDLRP